MFMNFDKDKYKTQNATGMWIKQIFFINLISLFIMYSFSSYDLRTSLIFMLLEFPVIIYDFYL